VAVLLGGRRALVAIADAAGVRMPGFRGYTIYSGAVLIPLFVGVTRLFF
jgi:hypothetical protein